MPGWMDYIRHCRQGLTDVPLAKLDFEQLKPEGLHSVIKGGAQLADVGQALGLSLDPQGAAVDLEARRHADLGT
jgi:hypothetical protein